MKPQFHKYQICEWEGREGVIIRTDYPDKGTIQFAFDNGYLYFTHDGRITPNSPVSLRPVGEARQVLTEWQRKELNKEFSKRAGEDCSDMVELIESILSKPEPPKWEPKQGEAVLVKPSESNAWSARVFNKMDGNRFDCFSNDWTYCIPFDTAKVGTVTND